MARLRQTNQQKAGKQLSGNTTQAAFYGTTPTKSKSKKKARKSKGGY